MDREPSALGMEVLGMGASLDISEASEASDTEASVDSEGMLHSDSADLSAPTPYDVTLCPDIAAQESLSQAANVVAYCGCAYPWDTIL